MNQIGRRLMYLAFGVAPACLGTAFALVLGPLVLVAAAGTIGLIVASIMQFPLSPKSYGRVVLLLVCGLIIAMPFGIMTLYASLADGIYAKSWPALVLILWVFFGPVSCAAHTLWRGRCAPNNSFKPKPLRGSA